MELWLATGNRGKVTELKKLLSPFPLEIHSQDKLHYFSQPPEDGQSFEDNARIKARALHAIKPEVWTVADDSGLVVDALGGLPGVHSARYAGSGARVSENNAKLLKIMGLCRATDRKARFHCCLLAISPSDEEFICHGELEGEIARRLSGHNGFGYDPLFIPRGESRSLAEMSPGEKNAISHRAGALKNLFEILKGKIPHPDNNPGSSAAIIQTK